MYIISLSKKDIKLSLAEAKALLNFSKYELIENHLFIKNINKKFLQKLAYARIAYKLLFSCPPKELEKKIEKFNFSKIIRQSYKLLYLDIGSSSMKDRINNKIWNSLKNPMVDVKNPEIKIHFIKIKDKVYCCQEIYQNEIDFESRLPHKREGFRPISIHPQLARCLVNLSGCRKGTIIDPFCGISGILIEALLSDLNAEGYDIDPIMIRISRYAFMEFNFKVSKYYLDTRDFFNTDTKMDYIVTDLPYGKNTKNIDESLYEKFIIKLEQVLKKRAVVVFPHRIDVEKLLKKTKKLKLVDKFHHYIHGTMTRVITIIERK